MTSSDAAAFSHNVVVANSIESVVRITGIAVYMLVRSPFLGLCALAIVPVVAIVNKFYGSWLSKNASLVQSALAEANSVAQEAFACARTVVAFAAEQQEHDKYVEKIDKHYQLNVRQVRCPSNSFCHNCRLWRLSDALSAALHDRNILHGRLYLLDQYLCASGPVVHWFCSDHGGPALQRGSFGLYVVPRTAAGKVDHQGRICAQYVSHVWIRTRQ